MNIYPYPHCLLYVAILITVNAVVVNSWNLAFIIYVR
jgi:hypothetical protein